MSEAGPLRFRPFRTGVLVQKDPDAPRTSTIIHVHPRLVCTGTVLRVGPKVTDLAVGERVAFLRWVQDSQQGQALAQSMKELGDNLVLLDLKDILFVFEGEGDFDT